MKIALVNPPWTFEGSIYFGCREPHLPLESATRGRCSKPTATRSMLLDGQLDGLDAAEPCATRSRTFAART